MEFLLLCSSAGDDHFEASGGQKALFILRLLAGTAQCQHPRRVNAPIRLNPVNICFIGFPISGCLVWLVTYWWLLGGGLLFSTR